MRLERGTDRRPSPQVLDALGRVLGLDAEARRYIDSLVQPTPPRGRASGEAVLPAVLTLMEAAQGAPAVVLDRRLDVLAANDAATALYGGSLPRNMVGHVFLDGASRTLYPDWEDIAIETVAALRAATIDRLHDPHLALLVGELSTLSPDFARIWARHDVKAKSHGTKRLTHPGVGTLTVRWASLAIPDSDGQQLVTYEPVNAASEALFARLRSRSGSRAD